MALIILDGGGGYGSPPPEDPDWLLWISLGVFALLVFIIVGMGVFA